MWQRIQTIFLALVVLSMVLGIFFPIWTGEANGEIHKLFPLHYSVYRDGVAAPKYFPYSITAILMMAAATIAFIELRRYDDRILQIKLGTLNSVVLMITMISAVLLANQMINANPTNWAYGYGLYIPFVGVTFNWLAVRMIRKDEKKVRDSDRIR